MIKLLKSIFRPLYLPIKQKYEVIKFRKQLSNNKSKQLKIVVGSSGIVEKGWIPTDIHFLNLLQPSDWTKYFDENSIHRIFGEHVWEHLTLEEGEIAAETCFKFLNHNGILRVAVPDGYHPDENYISLVKPGGTGAGADDHKLLYNHTSFSSIFSSAGFEVRLLEYFDKDGKFHSSNWNEEDGLVRRSIRYDRRNIDGNPNYTSLILDAVKP